MPPVLQAKLLQVLQDGTFSRLGGRATLRADVRIIAATNVNIKQAIIEKAFREDLFYRLNGVSLTLPPLRERTDELPSLTAYFVRRGSLKYGLVPTVISDDLKQVFLEYTWPGNLRELENVINRLLVMQDEKFIIGDLTVRHPPVVAGNHDTRTQTRRLKDSTGGLKEMVRELKNEAESVAIIQILEAKGWNRRATASCLQISYKALLYKIKQYELAPNSRVKEYGPIDVGPVRATH